MVVMDEIKKLSTLGDVQVDQAVGVFVTSFYDVFSSISKDRVKLHKLFKCSFDYDLTYAYLRDGVVVGFLGLGTCQKRSIKLDRVVFLELMSGFAGVVSYRVIRGAVEKINVSGFEGVYIDHIATSPEYRGRGIATKFVEYVCNTLGYKYVELDVLAKNERAKQLYERLGFKVVKKKLDFIMVISGVGRRVVMRWEVK